MFNDVSVNATNFNQELRLTKVERLSEVVDIVNNSKENFIIWVKQNEEADYLKNLIPDAKEVRGNDAPELKEKLLIGFGKNEFRVLITKSKIAQFGLNYQNCHNQIFASLDFSFESLYQSIRRSYRFGQKNQVNIYLITTDTMQNVINTIKQKEAQFLEMQSEMNKNINSERYGLLNQYEYKEFKNNSVFLMKGDTNIEIKRIPDNSIDLIIFSPPFSSLFTYSNYIHDMGNNESHADFFKQYEFLLKELYRILKPGRIMACHTKDLGVYKNSSGYTGMYDFTGEHNEAVLNMIPNEWANDTTRANHKATEKAGFKFHSKITIWCDPVLEMQRTKTQRLLYKTVTSDSTKTGIGMAEYVTIFKKWDGSNEENWEAVTNLNKQNFPLDTWQKWASPVWMDIKRTDVLNGQEGTAMGDEKHIAPLQLEVIHRIVNLWSNEGETIFTPFLGIGSEAYVSLKNNRKAIGCELKDSYFDVAVKNCTKAESLKKQITMHL
jgi:DNA modification methylase